MWLSWPATVSRTVSPSLAAVLLPVTLPKIAASCCPEALAGISGTELTPWALRSAAAEPQVW